MNPVVPLSGCFKFTDADLEDVYSMMGGGTPIEIPVKRPPDEWGERYDAIQEEIGRHINGEHLVHYALFDEDQDELPVNNLHTKAIDGKVIFLRGGDDYWGNGDGYSSETLTNPTWLDVAIAANESILVTGNRHHVYLEAISEHSEMHGNTYMMFCFGS